MDVVPHLKRFCDEHLKTHGRRNSRQYLRDSIVFWRERYGDSVADQMEAHIRGRYTEKLGSNKGV